LKLIRLNYLKMEDKSEDYKQLPIFCFDVLLTVLKNKDKDSLSFPESFKGKQFPVFVTWTKGKDKDLRGCIGTFASADLETNLFQYSIYAAFKDTRFPPIKINEVKQLNCHISLLTNFEDCKNPYDWEVGTHGITIDFKDLKGKPYHGTFLPEVAGERNWDKDTTLEHLIQKTGYYDELKDVINCMKVTRYQSKKVGLSYDEYCEIRKNSELLI
jgi:uncharacterized protein (TIGR00296 family)